VSYERGVDGPNSLHDIELAAVGIPRPGLSWGGYPIIPGQRLIVGRFSSKVFCRSKLSPTCFNSQLVGEFSRLGRH